MRRSVLSFSMSIVRRYGSLVEGMTARARGKSVGRYRVLEIALTGGRSLSGHQLPEERSLDREIHKISSDAGMVWSKRKRHDSSSSHSECRQT